MGCSGLRQAARRELADTSQAPSLSRGYKEYKKIMPVESRSALSSRPKGLQVERLIVLILSKEFPDMSGLSSYIIPTINYSSSMCQGVKVRKSQKGELLIRDSALFFNFLVTFRFSVFNV